MTAADCYGAVRRGAPVLLAATFGLTVLVAGCASSTHHGNGAHSSARATVVAPVTVRTTLRGVTVLPVRVRWDATTSVPSRDVAAVDFSIDGALAWVEHAAPFVYADDGNELVTTFLKPGEHTFVTSVTTTSGATAKETVTATVQPAPEVPAELATRMWTRTLTASDQQKATSGSPPPVGRWRLAFTAAGIRTFDPDNSGVLSDLIYGPAGHLSLRATIETPPFPNTLNGGYCGDTDPTHAWSYVIGDGGRSLTLAPVGTDPCGDRVAVLAGTWTRS